jgi:rRNA maturation RNase YbeY
MITLHNRQRKIKIDTNWMRSVVSKIMKNTGYPTFDIGILLTNNATIRRYNKQYRSKDKATDILSFRYHADIKPHKPLVILDEDDKNLGDLILSLEYIQKAATEMNVSFEERLVVLLVHGICHLLGYDHETDADWRSMRAKEAFLLKKINS